MGQVTLKDIADSIGVSPSTVSLALRNSPRIAQTTRNRVVQAAATLGYHTNLAGSLLRTANPRIVGLACDLNQELHFTYYHHISDLVEELGFQLMVEDISRKSSLGVAIKRLLQMRSQAIIVIGEYHDEEPERPWDRVPLVAIGQIPPTRTADLVVSDNRTGMAEVAKLVAPMGAVLYVDGPPSISAYIRRDAFIHAAYEFGLAVSVVSGGATVDDGFAALSQVLATNMANLPGAVVCYNDQCAEGALIALYRKGVIVPEQTRVVGFDNSRIANTSAFALTSVDRQAPKVARLAVDMAVARSLGLNDPPTRFTVDTHLVRRHSA